jgi:hypothetical protein
MAALLAKWKVTVAGKSLLTVISLSLVCSYNSNDSYVNIQNPNNYNRTNGRNKWS